MYTLSVYKEEKHNVMYWIHTDCSIKDLEDLIAGHIKGAIYIRITIVENK